MMSPLFLPSYRLRYGLLGATAVALGFSCPAGLDMTVQDSTPGLIDVSGLVSFCVPLTLLALTCTGLIYLLRLGLRGRTIWWHDGLCMSCGYSLAGNLSGTCPECGAILESVSYPRDRKREWQTGRN